MVSIRQIYQNTYRFSYKIIRILLVQFRFLLPKKMQHLIEDRQQLKLIWRDQQTGNLIWFHCASGEIEYIKPLLRKLRVEKPQYKLFLTYFSPSGKTMAHNCVFKDSEADGYAALPWDEPLAMQNFMEQLKPSALVVSRTDLWPELLWQCHKKNVPTILVAATFAPGSKKMSWLGKIFLRQCLPLLSRICLVSEQDKKMIQEDFADLDFLVGGDPRYDQVEYRIKKQTKSLPENIVQWAKEPLFIAGSTWPEDEEVLLTAFQKTSAKRYELFPADLKLIIVPHETEETHLRQLSIRLEKLAIPYQYFSQTKNHDQFIAIDNKTQVLIFDQKGYLLDLYRLAGLAFIGGSFKKQVHSVMEAIGHGAMVLVGPYHQNNREAIEFQKIKVCGQTVVQSVQDSEDLSQKVISYFKINEPNLRNEVQKEFFNKTKATERTYQLIKDLL